MKAFTYIKKGKFAFVEKAKPTIKDAKDAIVRITMSSICTSDLHIKHGSVPRAVPGITVGHEMVGVVEEVGGQVTHVKPGDRVTVNVETYCGECFYCQHGYVNNCTSPHGGWALGCRIDGGQTEYVRVPYATTGLNKIPDTVSDEQALFVGDILATGFWATRISEIKEEDTVLIIGAGPTGVCCLLCTLLKNPGKIIVCEKSEARRAFIQEHYPQVLVVEPEDCETFVKEQGLHGGADVVMEVAGGSDTFQLAWKCARPNAIVTIAPYVRYAAVESKVVDLFFEGTIGYGSVSKGCGDFYEVGIKPGLAVKLTKHVEFISKIGFLGYRGYSPEEGKSLSTFGVDVDASNISFGAIYKF